MATAPTGTAVERIPPGIYYIVVAGPGHFIHERLTDQNHVTITPPSAKPDRRQKWQVHHGHKHGTITIARPGNIRPALSLTYKGDHGHPKEGDKLELRRDEFPTEWELDHAPGRRFYIRVPKLHLAEADASESVKPGRTLGIAVAPEKIHPPFLEIDHEDQLEWVFQRVPHDELEEDEA